MRYLAIPMMALGVSGCFGLPVNPVGLLPIPNPGFNLRGGKDSAIERNARIGASRTTSESTIRNEIEFARLKVLSNKDFCEEFGLRFDSNIILPVSAYEKEYAYRKKEKNLACTDDQISGS